MSTSKLTLGTILLLITFSLCVKSLKVSETLINSVQKKKITNILITMKSETLSGILFSNHEFDSRNQQLDSIVSALQSQSFYSQRNVYFYLNKSYLKSHSNSPTKSVEVESLWISNQMIVRGANEEIIRTLATLEEVEDIEEEKFYKLSPFTLEEKVVKQGSRGVERKRRDNQTEWGINKIQAPQVWKIGYRGQGIIVGTIDTGVRWTHEAIRENYAGLEEGYGWYDPQFHTQFPWDDHGHGTHVTGSLCGRKGIGVAPDVKWMTCKGCYGGRCSNFDLAACLQFMLCPTDSTGQNHNCSQAPNVLSNSWGGNVGGEKFFSRYMDALEAAGIVVVFAAGNEGPGCTSVKSPGDFPNVIAVGATGIEDSIAYFSSVGPSLDGLVKPEVTAPGHRINSAHNWRDNSYTRMSGTSMACPITAGVLALMLSKNPKLSIGQVRQILFNSTDPTVSTNVNCGGIEETKYPNHHSGHGRINAFKAVQSVSLPDVDSI